MTHQEVMQTFLDDHEWRSARYEEAVGTVCALYLIKDASLHS